MNKNKNNTDFSEPKDNNLLLKKAMEVLDDYLNAGFKKQRKQASEKAKVLYKEYYGKDCINRKNRL